MHNNSINNAQLFSRACMAIPGGVNSPVRAFRAVGGTPRFIARALGAYLWDEEGKRYIDYIGSWGPMILGHAHPAVLQAVHNACSDGFSFGAPTQHEIELAEMLLALYPSMEKVRLVNSGTEAVMSAIRLARGVTGKSKIIKFEGCYHGHMDALLVKAGSALGALSEPSSAGLGPDTHEYTLVLPYNDIAALEAAFHQHGHDIAALIVEPIAGNMNFVRGKPAFLAHCRQLCSQYQSTFIVDEVMTGCRVALGGAQAYYANHGTALDPDITILGKVIGGGMPLAAFGGKRVWMDELSPLGKVYQAGTLSGNPVATACGIATLKQIQRPGFFESLRQKTKYLIDGLVSLAKKHNQPFSADCEGGMFGFFLLDALPNNYSEVLQSHAETFGHLFHKLLDQGIYIAPALYEAGFVSAAHTIEDLDTTLFAFDKAFDSLVTAV